jgi:diadenosine tetraphosphate (Ap4A) HIT family hydrolase
MYDNNNIFAKIIRGEVPCREIYRDKEVVAFHDIAAAAPVHILVLPVGEYISFDDFTEKASALVIGNFFARVRQIANDSGLSKTGYRIIMNHGADASQSVPHFHVHILGGRNLGALLEGDHINR